MNAVRSAVCILLAVLLFLCFACGTAALSLKIFFSEPERMADMTVSGDYYELMRDDVNDAVERALMLMSLREDVFENAVADEDIDREAYRSLVAVYDRIINGSEGDLPEFEHEKLREAIEEDLRAYAQENGLVYEEGSADEVYEYLCGSVSQRIHVIGSNYISKIRPITSRLWALDLWYVPMIAAAVLAAAILLIRRRTLFLGFHTVLCALYAGSFLPLVVSLLFLAKDYMSNIIISNYALRELLLRLYVSVFSTLSKVFGISFIVVVILLCADIYLLAKYGTSVNDRRNRHPHRGKRGFRKTEG